MPSATAALVQGIVLGLGAAVPIGPVNIQLARRTLHGGFPMGFALGCGAVSVDVTYAILSSFSFRRLADQQWLLRSITTVGFLFLCYLGVQSLRGEREAYHTSLAPGRASAGSAAGAYGAGLLMTLLNPMTLGFWFVAVPAAAGPIGAAGGTLPMICVGVFIGTLGWVVFFAGLLSLAGRYRRNWWLAAADAAGGTMLLCVAAAMLWSSSRLLL